VAVISRDQCYLVFIAPEKVDVRFRHLSAASENDVLVKTSLSAISSGTEALIYRGLFPDDEERDSSISVLRGGFQYPFQYGYSAVGTVVEAANPKNAMWLGKRVFAFQPHASSFLTEPGELILLPDEIPDDTAVFLPNMETAVNFLMDGAPLAGERVAVIGLGVIGLLTTSILSQFPLASLTAIDMLQNRRMIAGKIPATNPITPEAAITQKPAEGYDLIYELSGSPTGLNLALALAGFETRVVIGSWYGKKGGDLNLGGRFHRSRIRLISSQVSTIASGLTGRWSKERRFSVAFQQLNLIQPAKWITHRFPLENAGDAYNQLIAHPEETLQIVFDYQTK
jgi:2-desacetyl-2-hydroxyethyl bacteriochlorophyllide A dehydrogenase